MGVAIAIGADAGISLGVVLGIALGNMAFIGASILPLALR